MKSAGWGIERVLAGLRARTGARSARLLDRRTAAVLGQVGADGAEPAGLAAVVRGALAAAAGDGGFEDVVLAARDGLHVLCAAPSGPVLHVSIPRTGDVHLARRELVAPWVRAAVEQTVLQQPALSEVDGTGRGSTASTARAVQALDRLVALPRRAPERRDPGHGPTWSTDMDTLQRIKAGLVGLR